VYKTFLFTEVVRAVKPLNVAVVLSYSSI